MATKASRVRVRRYVRSKGCHLIEDVVMAVDAFIGAPLPGPCHSPETRALVNAMERLREHAAGLERAARIIKGLAP